MLNPRRGRFLHLVPDEKFIDAAREIFEEASPDNHDFLFIGRAPLRLIRTFNPICMEIDAILESQVLLALPRYSAVFIHYLNDAARCFVTLSPMETRFVWLGWGGDFYHLIQPRDALILPETRALLTKQITFGAWLHKVLGRLGRWSRFFASPFRIAIPFRLYRILAQVGQGKSEELAMINRFLAISTPIREDFEAIHRRHPTLCASYLDWNYWTEGFDTNNLPLSSGGRKKCVLLGNSATPENNHIEALGLLSNCLPDDWRIFCPLSYGDMVYGDAVEKHGRALFGNRFIALRDYMPSEHYSRIVASCSVVVMNHVRQQALGNIILSLCAGSRVFLNSMNPIHGAMRRLEIDIATIDRLPEVFQEMTTEESDGTTMNNIRQKIEAAYGRTSILKRTHKILSDLSLATTDTKATIHT